MTDISTRYAGLTLRNPIIVGSSGLTNTIDKVKEFEKAGAGAIVLKSLFEEQIEIQSKSLGYENDYPEAADYVHEYVKANQVYHHLDLIKQAKEHCSVPIIGSINCYKPDVWIEFAKQMQLAGADALELNIFYLDADLAIDAENRAMHVQILRRIKENISIPVIIKLSKSVGYIPNLVHLLKINGADGVVLFNRFYQPDIDINKLQIVSGNVFSSHSDLSDTLRWTGIVNGLVPDISIASSTGVHEWEDVIKCVLAGASAVQIASSLYTHGAGIITQMLSCIEEWMQQKQYHSISEFKGKLNYANIENPGLYERAQFMKYLSNRD